MKTVFRGLSVSVLGLAAAGCSTPNPTALNKPTDVPPAFTAPVAQQAPIWPDATWWVNFKADELPALEVTAQSENLDLAQSMASVLQSEAAAETAFAPLLPSVNASGSGTRSGSNTPANGGSDRFSATFQASYQLDFWGANQDRLRQARENLRAARYAEANVGITIATNVADQYFTILALRQRITIARANIDAAKRDLTVIQAKVTAGVNSNLDLAQEQSQVASQEAQLPGLIEQEREARYALAILLGRAPEGFDVKGQSLEGIVSPAVQPGMPSELLLRRPDVAQAEANLYALHASLDAARAAFFPTISLTGQGGFSSTLLSNLVNPAGFAWSIGASLAQTIFDGGKLAAADDAAKAQQTGSIAAYRKAVFSAFSDVESALGKVDSDNQQLVSLTEEVRAATEAYRISELEYREGTIDILSLLQSQTSLFNAQASLISTQQTRLLDDVALYAKLGGGWSQQASDAAYTPQLDWWPL